MKTTLLALVLVLTGLELRAQTPTPQPGTPRRTVPRFGNTNGPTTQPRYNPAAPGAQPAQGSGLSPGGGAGTGLLPNVPGGAPVAVGGTNTGGLQSSGGTAEEEIVPAGMIDWEGVDLTTVLEIYAKYVKRNLIRAALPDVKIIFKNQTDLTRSELIQAIQAVLAQNNVVIVNVGEKFMKVLPSDQAGGSGGPIDRGNVTNLPSLGSYVTHVVQLNYVKPSEMAPILTQFGKLKDMVPLDGNGILIIRDYAENIKRMMELIEQVDVSVPAEYISEVIPIRYAKVDDIAAALNALGGGGGATVSIGTAPTTGTISGLANRGGTSFGGQGGLSGIGGVGGMGGGMGGLGGNTRNPGGTATPNGTPAGGANTFQQRLGSLLGATGGAAGGGARGGGAGGQQDQIQLFGQTKIIPNESSSTLLIYATRADMDVIKGIIDKLDVPLASVLIEAVIMDVNLGNKFNLGISAAQNPAALSPGNTVLGGGGYVNGSSPFVTFLKNVSTNYTSVFNGSNVTQLVSGYSTTVTGPGGTNGGSFANGLPGGLSYFANLGPTWDVALTAAESDNHASIIQRPRIQTTQAKPAQFFVGNTVPYVTGNSYGTAYGSGVSYSQLSVGVELDVTPFINPEGLVVMDIMQEIDDLNGTTHIDNVGEVPNTIKRTLNAELVVSNRDTVMLGGFIRSDKSHTQNGVPFLMDIPILGNLFKSRADQKDREELLVLMRPTVLPTPSMAARHTIVEEQRLPGVSEAAAEDAAYERQLINAQRKREEKRFKESKQYDGFFVPEPGGPTNAVGMPLNPALPHAGLVSPNQPGNEEIVKPIPQPVHPGALAVPAPGGATPATPAPQPGNPPAPPANPPTAPANPPSTQDNSAPDSGSPQERAAAALAEKIAELNAQKNGGH